MHSPRPPSSYLRHPWVSTPARRVHLPDRILPHIILMSLVCLLLIALSGCASPGNAAAPKPTRVSPPTATPTVVVSYGVVVTPFATARPTVTVKRHRKTPL